MLIVIVRTQDFCLHGCKKTFYNLLSHPFSPPCLQNASAVKTAQNMLENTMKKHRLYFKQQAVFYTTFNFGKMCLSNFNLFR